MKRSHTVIDLTPGLSLGHQFKSGPSKRKYFNSTIFLLKRKRTALKKQNMHGAELQIAGSNESLYHADEEMHPHIKVIDKCL